MAPLHRGPPISRPGRSYARSTRRERCGPSRLADRSVATIVKAYAARARFNANTFSGHSLRAGFLTSAAGSVASIFKMMDVSRHKSVDTLRGYVRRCRAVQGSCPGRPALRLVFHVTAGSTGRRKTYVKSLCRGFKLQGLTWPFVELTRHFVQIFAAAFVAIGSEDVSRVFEMSVAGLGRVKTRGRAK